MYIMFLIYVTFDAHDIAKEWEREGKELWITSLTDTTKIDLWLINTSWRKFAISGVSFQLAFFIYRSYILE